MPGIDIKKYTPLNPVLKKLIKFFWIIKSTKESDLCGKLIPMNNIDLIINLSSPIQYKNHRKEESFQSTHFRGIQNNYRMVQQNGILDIVGISFYPIGFYPFIKVPLNEFSNQIVPIENILPGFERKVERVGEIESDSQRISIIEEILMNYLDIDLLPEKKYETLINDFLLYGDSININCYCKTHGVNQKTLERFINKYAGTTPKSFLTITKFQKTIRSMRKGDFDSLTQIGYDYNYFDQTHFINSFKSFAGKTPAKQLKENDLILDILLKK